MLFAELLSAILIFYKKNVIILEGKKSYVTSIYNFTNSTTSSYSDRFKALWYYIINNIDIEFNMSW
jgi:hypothetical protein